MVITPAVGDGVPYPLIAAGERDVALLPMKRSRSGLQGGMLGASLIPIDTDKSSDRFTP